MEHEADLIEELIADHREMDALFEQFDERPPGCIERKLLLEALTIELVRHAVAEEMHLYPAVREHLENGERRADYEIAEHSSMEERLKDLEGRDSEDRDLDRLVRDLRTEATAHMKDEERHLFPQLRDGAPPFVLARLGQKVREAKDATLPRAHPQAPSVPPPDKLLAPGPGLVDRVRDQGTNSGHPVTS
ncbi:hemerythrin domain-containing protein [Streptomyces sp. Je 1-4]|uniref:hemerythrin domain-containing protein n=1 Tax=Streptomyces TaxID=1883 RepID=UPI0021DB0F89|nr:MULTISPECIES: hemerythrin domain-containing protein [unclassified Streptomyces]UYB37786.1 hemerythrin domain-containing protein [Streptomyces sp. Je 1-4]UZQ33699.1 hemerythrin domain-containing protein [Streptomyces sp. Je 1-4] [Streptomyces sp. Je 1-4 4N24]UZQ41117.1 hemerythrin domain-containing protein [Streptomyces sp. Je 1-4] [Streptomyces sp. Je 1-4 4N24_ara]